MASRWQTSAHNNRRKGWRGSLFEKTANENAAQTGSCGRHHLSESEEINQYRTNIRRSIQTSCLTYPRPISPRAAGSPTVTWSQPPVVDNTTRRNAFEFTRPSRIYREDSEEMFKLRRRSHLLFDELERERQGNTQLRRQVERMRDHQGRVISLVNEIDGLRRENESLAQEIRVRKEARTAHAAQIGSRF